jgi:hypothetical protein
MIIRLEISFAEDGFPTRDELGFRWELEDLLEQNQVGEVVGAGSGMGVMDIDVEVDDVDSALRTINDLLAQLHIENVTTISVWDDQQRY